MQEIELRGTIAASRPAVWRVLTDHCGWTRWAGVKEVVLRQQGDPPPNGLGAIRVVRKSGIAVEEEITAFDPPQRLAYRLVAGIPIRNHEGEVCLDLSESGTRVTWRARFDPIVPLTGGLLKRALARELQNILDRLARVQFDQTS